MARCEVCGNDYHLAFQVVTAGVTHTFDSFECAIHKLAPVCEHCGCRIIGHGVEAGGGSRKLRLALGTAVAELTAELGADQTQWRYGQAEYKHVLLRHPLGRVVSDSLRAGWSGSIFFRFACRSKNPAWAETQMSGLSEASTVSAVR